MTEFITLGTCDRCAGAGTVPHSNPGATYACSTCNGHGVAKRAGYGGYKTAKTAATALANGHGRKCSYCDGTGSLTYPLTLSCYGCDNGVVVTSALPGQRWPLGTSSQVKHQSGRGAVAKAYADAVIVYVQAANRAGTWNESYLGLGSIVSVTDYGRVWDAMAAAAAADTLTAEVERVRGIARERLAEGTQWVKLTRDNDTLAEVVVITVHRNGYTVQAVGAVERVAVPPTYTEAVLNAPMG
jgi:ATP-dependent Clp protease adapter protein ClpS